MMRFLTGCRFMFPIKAEIDWLDDPRQLIDENETSWGVKISPGGEAGDVLLGVVEAYVWRAEGGSTFVGVEEVEDANSED